MKAMSLAISPAGAGTLAAAAALYLAQHDFCRMHSLLKMMPAMTSHLTDRIWEIEELYEAVNCTER